MKCRVCDSEDLTPVLDLGKQPWANNFLTLEQIGQEPTYPLRLMYCQGCCCAQLDYTVPKEVMFSNHTYVSGTTKTLSNHFRALAEEVTREFDTGTQERSILDIGSNDGTQLKHYQNLGYSVLGVEACEPIAQIANREGVPTLASFFNEDVARSLGRTFSVINASGVFFHLEELHSVARGIKLALKEEGVFVIQFLYMKSIMENLAFDQIYHEHLLYYTLRTVETLLNRHALASFDAALSPIHGGSIVMYATHREREVPKSARLQELIAKEERDATNSLSAYQEFGANVLNVKRRTIEFLSTRKGAGKTIFGFGAPVKGNTFLNYCGIGAQYLDCLVEKNPLRRGLYSPGTHLPLVMEDELESPPDCYLVLAWNFRSEILNNNMELIERGVEFYFPVNAVGV